jgi:hypothetical protein
MMLPGRRAGDLAVLNRQATGHADSPDQRSVVVMEGDAADVRDQPAVGVLGRGRGAAWLAEFPEVLTRAVEQDRRLGLGEGDVD